MIFLQIVVAEKPVYIRRKYALNGLLKDYCRIYGVVYLASYREGCPNAVLESLPCGTPVVATNVGAVRDILQVPEAGCIVPKKQVEPLKEGIEKVLSTKWDAESVLENSRVRSWEQVTLEVQMVFKEIV